jgi:hypothetical protein
MDSEFHYYMTYIIALRAGFKADDAYTIAYSSQYTDDNDTPYEILGEDVPYKNYISQTMDITKPKEELLRIYPFFHFFPGSKREIVNNSYPRKDGKLHLLNTIPNNVNVKRLFTKSLKSADLYRIGIATHTYADTFCHQNFVGFKEAFNDMEGLLEKIIPSVGHADAKYQPDIPGLAWFDRRHVSSHVEVRNKDCILEAAENIFLLYCEHCTQPKNAEKKKEALKSELDDAIGETSNKDSRTRKKERKKNYISILKSIVKDAFRDYDEDAWFDKAVSYRTKAETTGSFHFENEFFWKSEFKNSDWFKFQEAVKFNQKLAESILYPLISKLELQTDIW